MRWLDRLPLRTGNPLGFEICSRRAFEGNLAGGSLAYRLYRARGDLAETIGRQLDVTGLSNDIQNDMTLAVPETLIELPGTPGISARRRDVMPMSSPCTMSMTPPWGQPMSRR